MDASRSGNESTLKNLSEIRKKIYLWKTIKNLLTMFAYSSKVPLHFPGIQII